MEVLRTPFYKDPPRAFRVADISGVPQVVGAYARTLALFSKYKNYDLQLIDVDTVKVSEFHRGIENGFYNISLHPGASRRYFANVTFSYPVEWSKSCVMVSAEPELPIYWYVVWPFGRYIWTIIGATMIYVAYLMRCLKHPTANFSLNLLTSLAVVLQSSNMCLKMVNAALRLQVFYSLLMVMGFVLNSYYCCYLATYNLRPVFQPFPRTVEDLVKANRKIWVSSNMYEELSNDPYVDLTPLNSILVEKSRMEIGMGLKGLNRSFALVITFNDWLFMQKLQRGLIQPKYQLSDICFDNYLSSFPLQVESKFIRDLDYFILLVQQSGLWEIWDEEAFTAAMHAKMYPTYHDAYPVLPLNLYYFRIAWIVLFGGCTLSSFCIIGEVMVHSRKNKVHRIRSCTSIYYVRDW